MNVLQIPIESALQLVC